MNSQTPTSWKNGIDWISNVPTIATVVMIDTDAHKKKIEPTIFS
jgi:hypothetical protein